LIEKDGGIENLKSQIRKGFTDGCFQ